MLKRIDTNVMNLINFGFDCLSDLDTNVKDGYERYEFEIGWVRLFDCLMDTNVMNLIQVVFDCLIV